jgi:hypothetical protein
VRLSEGCNLNQKRTRGEERDLLAAFMADPAIRSDRPTEIIKKSGRPEACIRGDWDIGPHGLEPG